MSGCILGTLYPEISIFTVSTPSKPPCSGLQGTWEKVQNHVWCPQTWTGGTQDPVSPPAPGWHAALCTRAEWIISSHELLAPLRPEHSWLTSGTKDLWQSFQCKSTERKFTLGTERFKYEQEELLINRLRLRPNSKGWTMAITLCYVSLQHASNFSFH